MARVEEFAFPVIFALDLKLGRRPVHMDVQHRQEDADADRPAVERREVEILHLADVAHNAVRRAGELPRVLRKPAGRIAEEGGERQKKDNDHHADTRAPARMPRRAEPAAAGQQHDRRN